jgi:SAM-dependent methyltransferase
MKDLNDSIAQRARIESLGPIVSSPLPAVSTIYRDHFNEPRPIAKDSLHNHWNHLAHQWHLFAPPLRPCTEDVQVMTEAVARWSSNSSRQGVSALLCGVTPEIANMDWPDATYLLAVEKSEEMISIVWPGHDDQWRRAEIGDWLHLPLPDKALDVIIGDGCFVFMNYPDGYRALAASLHRVLKDDGIIIMRFFVQPEEREEPQHVLEELRAGRIGSFHAFRWRLAMAVQTDTRRGVQLNDMWQAWMNAEVNRNVLSSITGWQQEVINTVDLLAGKEDRYTFPRLTEVQASLSEYFIETAVYMPDYELGERCPTLTFRPKAKNIK